MLVACRLRHCGSRSPSTCRAIAGRAGLAPENTLAAFAKALEIGVTTLETDLAVTKDGVLVLSHDPVLNPDITRQAGGTWLAAPGPGHQHSYAGRAGALRRRPHQAGEQVCRSSSPSSSPSTARASRPLPSCSTLRQAVRQGAALQHRDQAVARQAWRNARPGDLRPGSLSNCVRKAGVSGRTTIQSFDWRTLIGCSETGS